jgi:hypothetical protein
MKVGPREVTGIGFNYRNYPGKGNVDGNSQVAEAIDVLGSTVARAPELYQAL